MNSIVGVLTQKLWISQPLFPKNDLSKEDIRSRIIGLINKSYQNDLAFKEVLDILSSVLDNIQKIVIAPPTSSAGAYLSIWGATGRPPADQLIIVAYDRNYEEYTINIIIHELAHKLIRQQCGDVLNVYDEALAYFLAFKAGFKTLYKGDIEGIIEVFSRYRPPSEVMDMIRYEIATIYLPIVIADILSDAINIEDLREFLDRVFHNPTMITETLRIHANEQQLQALGCMIQIISKEPGELKWFLEKGQKTKEASAEEFFKAVARIASKRHFDEHEYLYRNLVALLSLPVASKEFGFESAKFIFREFLKDAKACGEEVYEYLNKFIEMPDLFVSTLYEAAELGILLKSDINRALEEAKDYINKLMNND